MKDTEFVDSSAYIRVQEKRLISSADYDRMIDAPGTQELLRLLSQGSDYDFSALAEGEDPEVLLSKERTRVYRSAYGLTKYPQLVDVLACRYDFHNLKTAIKAKFLGGKVDTPYIEASRIPSSELVKAVEQGGEKSDLPPEMLAAIESCTEVFGAGQNPQDIDIVLDKAMFGYMLKLAGELDNAAVTKYVRMSIDFYNIKALMRAKNMGRGTAFLGECLVEGGHYDASAYLEQYAKPPGSLAAAFGFKYFSDEVKQGIDDFEKSGNYSQLERLLDNVLIESTKSAKYLAFGAEILFAYLISKENELRQVRILIACKNNNISPEALRERLRDNYA